MSTKVRLAARAAIPLAVGIGVICSLVVSLADPVATLDTFRHDDLHEAFLRLEREGVEDEKVREWVLHKWRSTSALSENFRVAEVSFPLVEGEGYWNNSALEQLDKWWRDRVETESRLPDVVAGRGLLLGLLMRYDPPLFRENLGRAISRRDVEGNVQLLGLLPFAGGGLAAENIDTAVLTRLITTQEEFEQFIALGFAESYIVFLDDDPAKIRKYKRVSDEVVAALRSDKWLKAGVLSRMRGYLLKSFGELEVDL